MKSMAIALVLLLVLPLLALAQCPVNHFGGGAAGHGIQYDSTKPSDSYDGSPVVPGVSCIACYSWPIGFFHVYGNGPTDWGSFVNATDRFQLVGPSTNSPFTFSVRLRAGGFTSASGNGVVGIGDLSGSSTVLNIGPGESFGDRLVILSLQHPPNDPFDLVVDLDVSSDMGSSPGGLEARLEFQSVPEGYSIVSCQGYDVPVPTIAQTWGRLRASYR